MSTRLGLSAALLVGGVNLAVAQGIQHDTEHYILLQQYGEAWAAEDAEIDQKLAELREGNGGKPPNIVYILIDDMGFGEFGMPELNKIRGGRTDSLDQLASQGAAFTHFYAENICTSTRVAMMTGRYADPKAGYTPSLTNNGNHGGQETRPKKLLARKVLSSLQPQNQVNS